MSALPQRCFFIGTSVSVSRLARRALGLGARMQSTLSRLPPVTCGPGSDEGSSKSGPPPPPAVQFDADNLVRSLHYEAKRGFGNAQGRERLFSEYAQLALSALQRRAAMLDATASGGALRLADQFARYGGLSLEARRAAVAAALELVQGLPPPLRGAPAPEPPPKPTPEAAEAEAALGALVSEAVGAWRSRGYALDLDCGALARLRDAAEEAERVASRAPLVISEGEQRTTEWHALRAGRVTASNFGSAIGYYPASRMELWEQKVGIGKPFAGNDATRWGEAHEAAAAAAYEQITGRPIQSVAFAVYRHGDPRYDWIGASPDGLVGADGALEIKCPWNRGRPEEGKPYPNVPFYYAAQVQGVMEVTQRAWCDVLAWTPRGLALYRVPRDRAFWAACFRLLDDFWHQHCVPARAAFQSGGPSAVAPYRPPPEHPLTRFLTEYSKALSMAAPPAFYEPAPP